MKKRISFIVLIIALISIKAEAQYGDGSDGFLLCTNVNYYTDENRAAVTSYTSSYTGGGGSYSIELEIVLDNVYGFFDDGDQITHPSLSDGTQDEILIVSVNQSGRNYDGATVTDYDVSTNTITATCWRTNATTPNVNTGSYNVGEVMVLVLPQYSNVQINDDATLTCHVWDPSINEGTGGILAF